MGIALLTIKKEGDSVDKIEIRVYDNYLKGSSIYIETVKRAPFLKKPFGLCCRYKGGVFMVQSFQQGYQQIAYIHSDLPLMA